MTYYATRQPLQTLSMATQPPERRRSARLAFGSDEDGKDRENVKRTKRGMDGGAGVGARQVGKGKKKLASYDEEDDGFIFRRTRSTKTKATQAQAASEPVVAEKQERAVPKRKSFSTPVTTEKEPKASKKRKSPVAKAREEPPVPQQQQQQRGRNGVDQSSHQTGDDVALVGYPGASSTASYVGDTTKIVLPFADTPVINRNKQLRQQNGQGRRRSSVGLRGRRASSLIDSGSTALPHAEVDTKDFYKHISEDGLTEPRRMKQLLTWCGTRALGEKPSYSDGDVNARLAARVIQEELLKDFSNRPELSDWFNREESKPAVIVKKANPKNSENAAKIQELEEQLKRINEEKEAWSALRKPDPARLPPLLPTDSEALLDDIDPDLLDPEQAAILKELRTSNSNTLTASVEDRLKRVASRLELTVDRFADGLHKLGQYQETADRVASRVLALAAEQLDRREKATLRAAGTENMPLQDVLRSIARIER